MYSNQPESSIELLLVEDDHLYRAGLKDELEREPLFKVIGEAENGQVGVDLARKLRPDIVLMDLGLPVMDGLEATREIKKTNPDIKVIVLTCHTDDVEAMLTLSVGANAYTRKDVLTKYLVMIIETVNKGAVWVDPSIGNMVLAKLR